MEPPIELDELMERIRAASQAPRPGGHPPERIGPRPVRPPVPEPPGAPPALVVPPESGAERADLELALAEAASMLPRAREKTEVRAGVPPVLRSLFRNQGGFNGILLETSGRLLQANQELQRQNLRLQGRLDALEKTVAQHHDWAASVVGAHEQQREWMLAVESFLLEFSGWQEDLEQRLKRKAAKAQAESGAQGDAESLEEFSDAWFLHLKKQLHAVDAHADRLGGHLNNLQTQVDEHGARYGDWHEQYRQAAAHHETLGQNARRLEERQHNDASFFKNQLWFLQRLIQPLLAGEKANAAAASEPSASSPPMRATILPGEHDLDALYLAFEEVMRGSRNAVKEQAAVYLPYIAAANAGTIERPVLDLGCGRGEWLEILGEHHLAASGVDLNTCMVELCRERNLPVVLANAIDHLRALPDASCGAITAFHFIEHLPFPVLVGFLRECRRVVQPGGVVIFETPNPYNVLVGSGFFYHDFTHQRPLPPNSTKFLVEQLGFAKAEILPLHPWDESAKVHGEGSKALEWRFNELFYGPQDYALIATP